MAKKNGFISEFKAFITRGNILDMAVGVIMGGAFGKIVSSLVADIIMPAIGKLFNTTSLTDMKKVLTEAVIAEDGVTIVTREVAIRYGQFIQYIIDFIIVAFCMFLVIKLFMGMRAKLEALKKQEEEVVEEAPAEPTIEEQTLATLNDIKAILEKNSK
jgi:large conductance mechanosensitive channel